MVLVVVLVPWSQQASNRPDQQAHLSNFNFTNQSRNCIAPCKQTAGHRWHTSTLLSQLSGGAAEASSHPPTASSVLVNTIQSSR